MREESKIPTSTGKKLKMTSEFSSKTSMAVVGSLSMVGSRFCELSSKSFSLIKTDLKGDISIDITQRDSVDAFFKNHDFEWLILFSAFTDVDAAEKQRGDKNSLCYLLNVSGTASVVDACKNSNRKLIFISTDFVFDGQNGPYSEESQPGGNPPKVSWYGLTKIEAENYVRENLANFLILRIAYPYRGRFEGKDDIAKRILRLYQAGQLYPMFTDQIITPTFIDDIAEAVKLLISSAQEGIFHLVSPRETTQFEFAEELIRVFKGDSSKIQKGSIIDFLKAPGYTPRPINGGLKVDKINALGFIPTDWQEGIKIIHEQSKGQLV